jgi:ABC-type transport system involved in multi-copper enzyme maturation permease subunit
MSSKAITERPESPLPGAWRPLRESAPSIMRADEPGFARWVGLIGLMLITAGTIALVASALGSTRLAHPGIGVMASLLGLAALLFHAFRDSDLQIRRTYGALGYLLAAGGVVVSALPIKGAAGAQFLPYGFCFLTLGLLFLLPFIRNETEEGWRRPALRTLGSLGASATLIGFIGGNISADFLLPNSFFLLVVGFFCWWAFLGFTSTRTDFGYRAAQLTTAVGLLFVLIALGRSILPPLFFKWHWLSTQPASYVVPSGLLLMGAGIAYALLGYGLWSDNRLVVLTRRELSAFFYSPIAYFVLLACAALGWFQFTSFLGQVVRVTSMGQPFTEPVIGHYIIHWVPVICVIFGVPLITMRLLSEEKHTGTMEVLLTAPVDDVWIVLSKFVAALGFYLTMALPWALLLVALRYLGGEPFEYRTLFSFFVAFTVTGAAFLSMGLFFSALTRNQIVAAVLTAVLMLLLTFIFFVDNLITQPDSPWHTVLEYVGYIQFWISAVNGTLWYRQVIFHASVAVFWLFVTIKVVEARKWS